MLVRSCGASGPVNLRREHHVSDARGAVKRGAPRSVLFSPAMRPLKLPVYFALLFLLITGCHVRAAAQRLTPHHITLANGKSFDLNLPAITRSAWRRRD